nr:hypothetical protein [Mucilaginibacter sp. X4EP1]
MGLNLYSFKTINFFTACFAHQNLVNKFIAENDYAVWFNNKPLKIDLNLQ